MNNKQKSRNKDWRDVQHIRKKQGLKNFEFNSQANLQFAMVGGWGWNASVIFRLDYKRYKTQSREVIVSVCGVWATSQVC
jgi:ABC-type transport system involved in Fe-S cluster assembly fused permease/ATPase subunit